MYAEKHLRKCLDSVLAQTHSDFELIISDDMPRDRGCKIPAATVIPG